MTNPEDRIKGYLYHDETIVWIERSGGSFSVNWKIFIVLATLASMITLLLAAISPTVFTVKLIIFIGSSAAALFAGVFLPYYLTYALKQTHYAVTNRRILSFNNRELKSCELYKISEVRIIKGGNKSKRGSLVIVITSPVFSMNGRLNRIMTRTSVFNFTDVPDVEAAYKTLLLQISEMPDRSDEIFPF